MSIDIMEYYVGDSPLTQQISAFTILTNTNSYAIYTITDAKGGVAPSFISIDSATNMIKIQTNDTSLIGTWHFNLKGKLGDAYE